MGKVDSGLEGDLAFMMLGIWRIADGVCTASEFRVILSISSSFWDD